MGNLCITFDDVDGSVYQNAFPILKKYGVPATFFVCGKLIQDKFVGKWKGFDTITIKQLLEMQAEGWEMGNHTYSHAYLTRITLAGVEEEINKNINFLNKNGIVVKGFSYPWGMYGDDVIKIVKKYHSYARATRGRAPSKHPEKYRLPANFLAAKTKLCHALDWIKSVENTENTRILFAHRICDAFDGYSWPPKYFELILRYAVENGINVKTMGEVYG